jgi:polyhydroxybutyrate depolymerase
MLALVFVVACSSPGIGIDAPPGSTIDAPLESVDAPISVSCAGKMAQPLDATWTVSVGSRNRIAKVHVPASYNPQTRTPVVLNIHGRTHNASGQATLSKAIAKSNSAGFILVHPESATSPTSWNAGSCCDPASTTDLDDVGFIEALLDELESKLCVDTDRVYSMGLSNGAYLSHKLACEVSDRIAAIGPVAGLHLQSPCSPTRSVPVMMVNGTDDTLSTYQYVDESVDFWKAKNACTTTSTTYSQGDATCVTYGGCSSGADVVLCTIQGGGHQWPGGDTLPFLGKKSNDLNATDALWTFFVAHPRT